MYEPTHPDVMDALRRVMKPANDPATVCRLLRVIAAGSDARYVGHDVILNEAARMIEAFVAITLEKSGIA